MGSVCAELGWKREVGRGDGEGGRLLFLMFLFFVLFSVFVSLIFFFFWSEGRMEELGQMVAFQLLHMRYLLLCATAPPFSLTTDHKKDD